MTPALRKRIEERIEAQHCIAHTSDMYGLGFRIAVADELAFLQSLLPAKKPVKKRLR